MGFPLVNEGITARSLAGKLLSQLERGIITRGEYDRDVTTTAARFLMSGEWLTERFADADWVEKK